MERYPPVAVLGAWVQALVGRPAGAERWADAAERPVAAAEAASGAQMPPDGSTMESYLAMLRGLCAATAPAGCGQAREHLGGFCIIEAEDLDAALVWASKATAAVRKPIEVWPFAAAEA